MSQTRHLLIVDDDLDDQELLLEALKEAGFTGEISRADDGDEALAHIRGDSPRPDLILLDLHMPRMRGFEVLAQMGADPALRAIPVVVLTTSWSEEDISRAYQLGVNSFIIKPVLFDELVQTAQSLLHYWFELSELPPAGA